MGFVAEREQQHLKECRSLQDVQVSQRCKIAGPFFPDADSTFSSCTILSCWVELFEALRSGKRGTSGWKSEGPGKGVSGCSEHSLRLPRSLNPTISPSAVQGAGRARGLCHIPVCFGAECTSTWGTNPGQHQIPSRGRRELEYLFSP